MSIFNDLQGIQRPSSGSFDSATWDFANEKMLCFSLSRSVQHFRSCAGLKERDPKIDQDKIDKPRWPYVRN